ncbi:MAG: arginine--tRNA ligase [Bacteroidales bacterium]|nr:arginine--tRNA ligase [Candidatus Hennigimonas equi]
MNPDIFLAGKVVEAVSSLYGQQVDNSLLQVNATRKEFEGDYTLVVFPLLKISRQAPEATANAIGEWLSANVPEVASFNVVKGFLNICLSPLYWNRVLDTIIRTPDYGQLPSTGRTIMVEFSSPNTNKPLHLGHVRNNLLGWSVSQLLAAAGNRVIRVNLVNDRGIHICKSMLAWLKTANGATPETSGKKGDHLVGDCYVAFNDIYKKEVSQLQDAYIAQGMDEEKAKELAEKNAPSLVEAQDMLLKWEQGDPEVRKLWETMNSWVYDGFGRTYSSLGISFDRTYYESQTYLLGKSLVQKGLENGVFERAEDGSVWCDLTSDGLDRKLLLRKDGTSVYMTQDLGTAHQRFNEYKLDEEIYVVGNEQNYHFQVLKLILKKLGFDWSDAIYHMSYGMVELPEGKMKSREGTVVDADDLIEDMYRTAKETSMELGNGKLDGMSEEEQDKLFRMIGLGALKYFIIKVDPKKTMLFDPKESIDFNGNTGPFIQYTHARICSILRKAAEGGINVADVALDENAALSAKEIRIVKILAAFPDKIAEAAQAHSPALVANFAYELAKEFNQYYHDTPVLKEKDTALLSLRLHLISVLAAVLRKAMGILGISLPEKM